METESRYSHPSKADAPIFLTPSGMVTDFREKQSRKASPPISVTPSGIEIVFRDLNLPQFR